MTRTRLQRAVLVTLMSCSAVLGLGMSSVHSSEHASSQGMHALRQRAVQRLAALPLRFEPNRGQMNRQVRFLARGSGYTLFLTAREAVLSLSSTGHQQTVLRLQPVGAASHVSMVGQSRLPGTVSYFTGNDPHGWHANIPTFGRFVEQGVYPGIDLAFYGHGGQLEYDWLLHPGADPSRIALRIDGARHPALTPAGDLTMQTAAGVVIQHHPLAYQQVGHIRHGILSRYIVGGHGVVRLWLGPYDHRLPLIVDPTLTYSTYLGGSGEDSAYAVAVDVTGAAYVTGYTTGSNFPTQHGLPPNQFEGQLIEAFVTKLTPTGDAVEYSTYLGPGEGYGIAVDGTGDATVTGGALGSFPQVHQIPGAAASYSQSSVFVARLHYDPVSQQLSLLYSTLLGGSDQDRGSDQDQGNGIALDLAGNAYVTGRVASGNFPSVHGIPSCTGVAFAARIDYDPSTQTPSLIYSTCLAGQRGQAIAVDRYGNAYVTGNSAPTDRFQTTDGSTHHGGQDVFVTKLSFDGVSTLTIAYSTLIGGSGDDYGSGIAVDDGEDVYLGGRTASMNFPTLHALQPTAHSTSGHGFVLELHPTGAPLFSTYLGGSRSDDIFALTIGNSAGVGNQCVAPCDVFLTGDTNSPDFPSVQPLGPNNGACGAQVIAVRLTPPTDLRFSTTLGGCTGTPSLTTAFGQGIAVTRSGDMALVGFTDGYLPTAKAVQPAYGGGNSDAFVLKIAAGGTTAARVSRFVAHRQGASLRFDWRLAISTDVIGFDLYVGTHRLNAHTIPAHASPVYHYRVTGTIHGRYTLHVLLRDGRQLTVPLQ